MNSKHTGLLPSLLFSRAIIAGLAMGFAAFANILAAAENYSAKPSSHSNWKIEKRVEATLRRMTLDEKLSYLGGAASSTDLPTGAGSIAAIPRLGLPEVRMTDGPGGVQSSSPSTGYPCGLLLAASWDPDLSQRFGAAVARDARARGFDIWLGPGANFYRLPIGGRNSEYVVGEDPLLGSKIVTPLIQGAQREGVITVVKHYVANDVELNRFTIDEEIDERTLREIYLPPFEAAVRDGGSGAIMGAYNLINGDKACESHFLLTDVLADEWGYKGLRMSDWVLAVTDGVKAAKAGLDIEMPTASHMSPDVIKAAIASGQLTEADIDDKARRVLRLIYGFGIDKRPKQDTSIPLNDPKSIRTALDMARGGIVLLKNQSQFLPLKGGVSKIAVVGRLAAGSPPGVGGSGTSNRIQFTSEIDGIRAAAQRVGATADFLRVGDTSSETSEFQHLDSSNAVQEGLVAEYFTNSDLAGTPVATRVEPHLDVYVADVPAEVTTDAYSARWTGRMTALTEGEYVFRTQDNGHVRVYLNGQLVRDTWDVPQNPPLFARGDFSTTLQLTAGQVVDVVVEFKGAKSAFAIGKLPQMALGWAPLEAPANLGSYDAVIAAIGYDQFTESEGSDKFYTLPEYQDTLVRNLVAANPKTVVVLHGGGGTDIHRWIDSVPALLHAFFPGQEGGTALGEVLFGETTPSGKLPFTFEKRLEDNPAYADYLTIPTLMTRYSEGIFVGYRGFDRAGIEPYFPFGHGLSYTKFRYSGLKVTPGFILGNRPAKVRFTITNTGGRPGAEVAQLYVSKPDSGVERPLRELKGFKKVTLRPGESRQISLELDRQALAYFDEANSCWATEPGLYQISVGASSRDLKLHGNIFVWGAPRLSNASESGK